MKIFKPSSSFFVPVMNSIIKDGLNIYLIYHKLFIITKY